MNIVIIRYNSGNVCSLNFAIERLGFRAKLTDDLHEIMTADKVLLPGVGEAGTAMKFLEEKGLSSVIRSLNQPLLGICLGMQLLCTFSDEGNTPCLGILPHQVRKFSENLKVPHVGWNSISRLDGPLFQGIKTGEYMYFVHSYYMGTGTHTIAETGYGVDFSAALNKENFYGTQFHPEKSGDPGHLILKNFLNL